MLRIHWFNDQGSGYKAGEVMISAFLTTQRGVRVSRVTQDLKPNSANELLVTLFATSVLQVECKHKMQGFSVLSFCMHSPGN